MPLDVGCSELHPVPTAPAEALRTQRVSTASMWGDPVWRFPRQIPGGRPVSLNWARPMHDGSRLSDPQWTHLLDLGRRLLWSLFQFNQRGMGHKISGLVPLHERIVDLLRWMAENEYIAFSEIDPAAARSYCDHLLDRHAGEPVSARTLALKIDILCRIHEQSNVFEEFPAARMPQHPFGRRSASDVASTLMDPTDEHIPPVPEALFLAIFAEALPWLDAPARDIVRLVELAMEEDTSLTPESNSYSYKLNLEASMRSAVHDGGHGLGVGPHRKPD